MLRDRLIRAVRNISIPVMLIQPAKDDSLEPSRVLGAEFTKRGKSYVGKVYPATGPEEEQRHCFGGARGMHVWAATPRLPRQINASLSRTVWQSTKS